MSCHVPPVDLRRLDSCVFDEDEDDLTLPDITFSGHVDMGSILQGDFSAIQERRCAAIILFYGIVGDVFVLALCQLNAMTNSWRQSHK